MAKAEDGSEQIRALPEAELGAGQGHLTAHDWAGWPQAAWSLATAPTSAEHQEYPQLLWLGAQIWAQ